MVYHEFPDLQWLKKQAEDRFSNRQGWKGTKLDVEGWPTVILNVSVNKTFRDNIRGPLSLFTNISGKSSVQCGNEKAVIHPGFFYISNHDQHYTLDIDHNNTQTFNIHFGEYWVDQAYQSIVKSPEKLLDDSKFIIPQQRVELYSKLYQRDQTVNEILQQIKQNEGDKLLEQETLYELLVHLLRNDTLIRKSETKIPALKNSTRQEIIKRLLLSTDYIYSYYDKELSLEELASVACLSKFHFLRLFKTVFGKTPHQFINEIKVERAKALLKKPGLEVKTIARQLGFNSSSSFSRTFYQHAGFYPSQYR